jgi:hypothetical protein
VYIVAGTGSCTTSTTNLHHTDQVHAPVFVFLVFNVLQYIHTFRTSFLACPPTLPLHTQPNFSFACRTLKKGKNGSQWSCQSKHTRNR